MQTLLRFADGAFAPIDHADLPPCIAYAIQLHSFSEEFDRIISDAGAVCVECYGSAAVCLEVWRFDDLWLVRHFTDDVTLLNVVIENTIDYLRAQSAFIATLAIKIMLEDRYTEWREEKTIA